MCKQKVCICFVYPTIVCITFIILPYPDLSCICCIPGYNEEGEELFCTLLPGHEGIQILYRVNINALADFVPRWGEKKQTNGKYA